MKMGEKKLYIRCGSVQLCLVACPNNRLLAEHPEITCELDYGLSTLVDDGEPLKVVSGTDAGVSPRADSEADG